MIMRNRFYFVAFIAAMMWVLPANIVRAEEKEKEEANETKVAIADVPAAVKQTLTEEAKGAKLESVDKETDDGKTIYEADVDIKGKNYEIKVSEDGTLISKKLDDESKEKGENGEKEEDENKEKK
jgi:hypothetical protein